MWPNEFKRIGWKWSKKLRGATKKFVDYAVKKFSEDYVYG